MFENTLIDSNQTWILWSILLLAAYFGIWAEKTKIGSRLSGAVVAILTTFVLSNLSIIPAVSEVYDTVWSYLVPLAIPTLLFKANLKRIIKEAGPTLIAFCFGAIGTVIGTIISFNIVSLGDEGWRLAGIFCSTYIGGSMNYVAAAEALQLMSGDLLTAGIAADNLVMTLYFLLLFAIPSFTFLQKRFKTHHEDNAQNVDSSKMQSVSDVSELSLSNLAKALAISTSVCAVGFLLQDITGIKGSGILIITAIVVFLATAFHNAMGEIKGADKVGTFLMQIFFAAIGASANIAIVIEFGPVLFIFAAIILSIHLLFLLTAGKIFKLDLAEIVIASNANMGGPTTAAAMAVARKWESLVIPAILVGTLGYAIATFIGTGVGYWLQP
ncbi:MAG: DUF819 family protein [Melioribacteraceae bacterium]|nr:MAG: DUF819 family protein [Ignavibacteriales bacterium]WKZ70270.1 MAG: DUF819 family protein [Melioribacteraceae bacterium]